MQADSDALESVMLRLFRSSMKISVTKFLNADDEDINRSTSDDNPARGDEYEILQVQEENDGHAEEKLEEYRHTISQNDLISAISAAMRVNEAQSIINLELQMHLRVFLRNLRCQTAQGQRQTDITTVF